MEHDDLNEVVMQEQRFAPLQSITRPSVDTVAAAHYFNRQPQTLRAWAANGTGPVKPVRVNGRLAWLVADIKRVLEGV
jgi:hypothetical protein